MHKELPQGIHVSITYTTVCHCLKWKCPLFLNYIPTSMFSTRIKESVCVGCSLVQYTVQTGVQNCIICFDCPAGTHIRYSTWVPIEVQINFRLVPSHIHIICINNMYYNSTIHYYNFFHVINTSYTCI